MTAASRTTLVIGDDDRNWAYVWDIGGGLHAWSVGGVPVTPWSYGATNADLWWHQSFHGGFRLPTGTRPGPLTLSYGPTLNFTAVAPSRVQVAAGTVPAGNSAAAVRAAMGAGGRTVTLAPGEHVWSSPLICQPWTTLRGYGATVHILANGAAYNPAIVTADYLSVYGVTFTSDVPCQAFLGPPGAKGGVVADVTFDRVHFGWGFLDVLVRDCRFRYAGVNNAPPGMYLRCRFENSPGQGWWGGGPRTGNTAVAQSSFVGCDRGLVLTTKDGDVAGNLFVNLDYLGCTRPDGELFLVEGNGAGHTFDHNLGVGLHATGCTGSLIQLDENAHGNLFQWPTQDALGRGIVLGSPWTDGIVPGKDVSGNRFDAGRVPAVLLGAAARDNTADGAVLATAAVQ
jgi:hypothetical protein